MPRSAIPQHVLDRDWKGTDNDSGLMRLKKKIQYIFAAGPNVPSGFWKWREMPLSLFSIKGKGVWRVENTDGSKSGVLYQKILTKWNTCWSNQIKYISRIQPWCRWHITLQWPLFFNCSVIYRSRDVRTYPIYQSTFGITKMFTFGVGYKRDGDKVYWPTANIGGNFE
jgi:hypothetical protein